MAENMGSTDACQEHPSRRRIALQWWLGGVVAAPVAVLSHELGHFLTFWALGLPGATLHYSSASWRDSDAFYRFVLSGDIAAAAELAPPWQAAAGLGMGLAATYAVVLAACLLCVKWRAHPAIVAIGYLSNIRIVAPVSIILLAAFGASVSSGCDECLLSLMTGVPLGVLTLLGIISLVASWWWLARYFPRGRRWTAVLSMCAGMLLGLVVYQSLLGPLLLP